MSAYEQLIKDLGNILGLPLRPDSNQSCLIEMKEISIQIDEDLSSDDLLLGCTLGQVLPGPYRTQLFRQALKINGLSSVPRGTFAFTKKNDSLILFQFIGTADLTGEKLNTFVQLFAEHAKIWIEALKRGEVPALQEDIPTRSGMFGLR